MATTYDSLDLGGDVWQMGQAPAAPLWQGCSAGQPSAMQVEDWLPATVPGNVECDLMGAGRLADPFTGLQNEQGRWVEQHDWWYRRDVTAALATGQRAHLIMHGVDYYSAVHGGGTLLGCHEGMFASQVYEVTSLLADGGFELAVRLWGGHALPPRRLKPWQRLAEPLLRALVPGTDMFPARVQTTKCQMSFGWDFAPRLLSAGIWDDVELVTSGPVFIVDIRVDAQPAADAAQVRVRTTLDSAVEGPARLTLTAQGDNFDDAAKSFAFDLLLTSGKQVHDVTLRLDDARLWQPWDRGAPALYRLTAGIEPAGGLPAQASTTFGVRSIALVGGRRAAHDGWTFVINGRREFIRGLNWTPADSLPGRLRSEHYATLLEKALAANANMLRVWGGGLREKRAFYDLCDRRGLLLWQEFPLACPNLERYPRDLRFIGLLEQEATAIVRDLRNHPSVVLWCGGNEFGPAKNKPAVAALRRITEQESSVPFRPASPSRADRHNWQVWHHYAPLSEYARSRAAFVSEFGLQAPPSAAELRVFIPPADLWPPGRCWAYHNAELHKLQHYAHSFRAGLAGRGDTLETFVQAAETAQARGVQIMVEHMRRRKGQSSGVMVWQLGEPWPSICWSLISYSGVAKPAYHVLARSFKPLLVSAEYGARRYRAGDRVDIRLWVVNDDPSPPTAGLLTLHVRLNDRDVHSRRLTLLPDSSRTVGTVRITLPAQPWLLRLEIRLEGIVIAENTYDLSYHDERAIPLLHRLLTVAGSWLLR